MIAHHKPDIDRTALFVHRSDDCIVETVEACRRAWSFRPHYHVGNEYVTITAGRARLQIHNDFHDLEAGQSVVIPAGCLHRFVPLDAEGWAFQSRFLVDGGGGSPPLQHLMCAKVAAELALKPTLQTDIVAVASACQVSAGHLSRVFKSETGTSLHNFHVLIALHKAKCLLREGAPVVDAALESGFFDQAHLNREFVRMLGLTPGTFREAWSSMH